MAPFDENIINNRNILQCGGGESKRAYKTISIMRSTSYAFVPQIVVRPTPYKKKTQQILNLWLWQLPNRRTNNRMLRSGLPFRYINIELK